MNRVNYVNVKGKYAYYFLIDVMEKMKIIPRGYAVIGLPLLWDISVKKYEKNNSLNSILIYSTYNILNLFFM